MIARGFALAALLAAAVQEASSERPAFDQKQLARIRQLSPRPPLEPDSTNAWADDPAAAWLGQQLFFDTRFSANGSLSCASCHLPERAFVDGKRLSQGIAEGERNVPTLLDVARQRWFFWDGHADTLWSQALKPLESPIEMGGSREKIARVIADDERLRTAFERAFGPLPDLAEAGAVDSVFARAGKALAAYERTLQTGPAPFDRFVAGLASGDERELAALSPAAQRGLALFVGKADCRLCHGGPNLSDGEFHNIGVAPSDGGPPRDSGRRRGAERVLADPFNARGVFSDDREGETAQRLAALKVGPENWGEFRTPSLRNVARTAPYMHAGQFATLAEVVRFYSTLEGSSRIGHHQEQLLRPLQLSEEEQADVVAFLESLSGSDPQPELRAPPAGPQPDPLPAR